MPLLGALKSIMPNILFIRGLSIYFLFLPWFGFFSTIYFAMSGGDGLTLQELENTGYFDIFPRLILASISPLLVLFGSSFIYKKRRFLIMFLVFISFCEGSAKLYAAYSFFDSGGVDELSNKVIMLNLLNSFAWYWIVLCLLSVLIRNNTKRENGSSFESSF